MLKNDKQLKPFKLGFKIREIGCNYWHLLLLKTTLVIVIDDIVYTECRKIAICQKVNDLGVILTDLGYRWIQKTSISCTTSSFTVNFTHILVVDQVANNRHKIAIWLKGYLTRLPKSFRFIYIDPRT